MLGCDGSTDINKVWDAQESIINSKSSCSSWPTAKIYKPFDSVNVKNNDSDWKSGYEIDQIDSFASGWFLARRTSIPCKNLDFAI